MPEFISQGERKARKEHTCNYCGEKIEKGETYRFAFLKDGGDVYQWKGHLRCNFIAIELWRYTFVCPDCEHYKNEECTQDKPYCLDMIAEILKENKLVKEKGEYSRQIWKLVPRERKK